VGQEGEEGEGGANDEQKKSEGELKAGELKNMSHLFCFIVMTAHTGLLVAFGLKAPSLQHTLIFFVRSS